MQRPKRFRSAASGGQRGTPVRGTEYQFAGSRNALSGPARALIAARRYQQSKAAQQPEAAPQSRSFVSPAELSAIRGVYRAERRFQGERNPEDTFDAPAADDQSFGGF